MKTQPLQWSLLLLPLLILLPACIRTDAPAPPPLTRGFTQMDDFTPSAVSIVYIIVELDPATGQLTVSPDPAAVRVNQKVQWIALDPALAIEVIWKGTGGPGRPCTTPARRCGGNPIPVPPNTRLEYAVRAHKNGSLVAEIDPILEILP